MTAVEKFTLQSAIFTLSYIIGHMLINCASRFILGGALMGWIFTAGYLTTLVIAGYNGVKNAKVRA